MQNSSQGQHAALAALVQSVNFLMPSGETLASSDIRTDPDFWALLRQLLVSSAIMSTPELLDAYVNKPKCLACSMANNAAHGFRHSCLKVHWACLHTAVIVPWLCWKSAVACSVYVCGLTCVYAGG